MIRWTFSIKEKNTTDYWTEKMRDGLKKTVENFNFFLFFLTYSKHVFQADDKHDNHE